MNNGTYVCSSHSIGNSTTKVAPDDDPSKTELLEALCHSQTRAREAEKAAEQAYADKEDRQTKKDQHKAGKRRHSKRRSEIRKRAVAFAVGLGLASAGLLLGWTMGWLFPSL
uniref:Uncharacterized protein n=1 Tax=Quercus lobata TaxID=97700 RepID=A0A7N2MGK0_QUELO